MQHRKRIFHVVGLCVVAALGLMSVTVTSAQAKGHWYVLDSQGKEILLEKTIEFLATKDTTPELLVPGLGLEIACDEFHTDDGLFYSDGSSLAVLLFRQCEVLNFPHCTVHSTGEFPGYISFAVRNLLILHKEKTYVLVSPHDKSLRFFTLEILGALCPYSEVTEDVTGHIVLQECSPNLIETHLVKHLWEQAPEKLFPDDVLYFGEEPARLDGSFWVELIGEHKGMKWKGLGK